MFSSPPSAAISVPRGCSPGAEEAEEVPGRLRRQGKSTDRENAVCGADLHSTSRERDGGLPAKDREPLGSSSTSELTSNCAGGSNLPLPGTCPRAVVASLVSVVSAAAQCGSCEGCSPVLRMPAVPRQEKPLRRLPAREGVTREQESNPLLNNSVRATCSEPVKLVLLGLVFLSLPVFLLSQSSLPLSFLSSFTQNTANKRLPLWCLRVSS